MPILATPNTNTAASDTDITTLIHNGLNLVEKGFYAEALDVLVRASDIADEPLSTTLADFCVCTRRFIQAQQTLQAASRAFVEAERDHTACFASLIHFIASTETPLRPAVAPAASLQSVLPPLTITCFGRFSVQREAQPVALCPNRTGQAILRYLVAQPYHRATTDAFMATFWPDDPEEVACHKVRIASSALRRSLNTGVTDAAGGGYLLCKDGTYMLNPAVAIHTDTDEFLTLYREGRQRQGAAAIERYEAACRLYTGPFLAEDLYSDWASVQREQLTQAYLVMCHALSLFSFESRRYDDAISWALAMVQHNRCDEVAYRQIMRAYAAAGRRTEAIQHYQQCVQALADELNVPPMPETQCLFAAIQNGEMPT